jgi:hypothetical protein
MGGTERWNHVAGESGARGGGLPPHFQSAARAVLGELQAINANREETLLNALFSAYAPLSAIGQPWAQAVIHRGQHLAINGGDVEQPWRLTAKGKYEMFGGSTLESIAPFWKR